MSDTYSPAPSPSAPAQANAPTPAPSAPSPGQVPIDPNPVHTPLPIGAQAPNKPAESEKSPRASIARAFERAKVERKGPADAKMGHNQPPEATPREKLQPIDLKRRPDDQPKPRERGDHGHFAPSGQTQPGNVTGNPGNVTDNRAGNRAPYSNPLPTHAPYREPPPRWDQRAKSDWGHAPESVRASVHRMHHEFGRAYQALQADQQAMEPIRHFDQMARQQGTSLQRALTNYVGIENKLREDPVAGLDIIVGNLNLRTPDGQKLTLRDVAWHVLNQSPEQLKLTQAENMQSSQGTQLEQLHQTVNQLAQSVAHMHYERQYAQRLHHTRSAVDRFADTHPRLDELGGVIKREIDLGFDLPTAYRRAELLYPATQAAQTRTATAQTRQANTDRSISGAPDSGGHSRNGNGATPRRADKTSATPRDAVAKAMRMVNGSL